MTTISNLPFKRFVMQVSTGAPQIKSNWQAMMADNLEKLKSPVWREASTNESSLVDHDFTKASHLDDSYDAYKMTGNYDSTAMTEVAYAGMVAYRYRLPDDYMSGSANITSISVPVYRDRFCKGGIHVAALFGGNIPTNFTWDNVRGTRGTAIPPKVAMMAQSDEAAPYLTASSAADDVATFAVNPVVNKSRYLWIILTIEDYEDGWEWYNKKEKRLYAIEGSARLAGDMLSVEFDADVTPDGAAHELAVMRGGVAPSLPEGSASGARVLELFANGDRFEPKSYHNVIDYARTIFSIGSDTIELDGQAFDVYWVTPFTHAGVTRNLAAVCGNFDDASIPGVPGFVLFDCDENSILRIPFSSLRGQIAHNAVSLFRSQSSKVGVTVVFVDSVPHAYVWVCGGSEVTKAPVIDINLSTNTAFRWSPDGSYSDSDVSLETIPDGSVAYTFYDFNVVIVGSESVPIAVDWNKAPLLWGTSNEIYSRCPKESWFDDLCYADVSISSISTRYIGDAEGWCYVDLALTSSGQAHEDGVNTESNLRASGKIIEFKFRYAETVVLSGSVIRCNTKDWVGIDPGETPSDTSVRRLSIEDPTEYLIYWRDPLEISGVLSFARHMLPSGGNTLYNNIALPPTSMSLIGNKLCYVTPAEHVRRGFLPVDDIPAKPSAANSALGLRTLMGLFYLGEANSVSRTSRERLGAAYSVRAEKKWILTSPELASSIMDVPVWRMSATALVVPFAVPTEWRAKTLRLDWTGWTGTATNGARFAVWLRAGHWQDACPQVLESDIPYDALKAEADGWMLLGRIDATLSGENRTASFDLAGRIGSAKVASLMLTAYAPTDGINPDANTAWPVGAAKEVDVVDGEVVNAGKAWLPDITLIG